MQQFFNGSFVTLVLLKMFNIIDLTWWWIFSPFLIFFAIAFFMVMLLWMLTLVKKHAERKNVDK